MEPLNVDQTAWEIVRATGEDRARFLHGMCTANVQTLAEGGWTRAAMLNIKGRVTAIIEIVNRGDHMLVLCEPGQGDKVIGLLSKHAIMDEVEFTAVDLPLSRVWTDPASVWTAAPRFEAAVGPASEHAVEAMRVAAGMPRYGVDVTEDNFPFESLLGRHVDYEKGCYIGQEPVYRVYSKGQPSKMLRGLAVQGAGPVAPGATIVHPDRAQAGTVTSAVEHPELGSIALGYVHRTVNQPGTSVAVDGRPATLVELPFSAPAGA